MDLCLEVLSPNNLHRHWYYHAYDSIIHILIGVENR